MPCRTGEALVASDGTWLLFFDAGWGIPDVHPVVKELLARAWVLRPPVERTSSPSTRI